MVTWQDLDLGPQVPVIHTLHQKLRVGLEEEDGQQSSKEMLLAPELSEE